MELPEDKDFVDPITFLEGVFIAQVHNGLTANMIAEKLSEDKHPEDLLGYIHMFLSPLSHGQYSTLRGYRILAVGSIDDQVMMVVQVTHASSGVVHTHILRCRGDIPVDEGGEVIITNKGDDQ